ncbi:hypothetical protein OIE52_50295 [Streptomyces canus]|uniref:hypothetical protein n=1 Tax=Streptomyces canus TaxID=58343 RepID=UPI002E28D797|nr:hypothetical protein [Streptomyces canus]
MKNVRRALPVLAAASAFAIATSAHAADQHTQKDGAASVAAVAQKPRAQNAGDEDATDRGIIGMALDLLTGTTPEASPTPGGLVVHTDPGGQFHQAYPGTVPS